MAERSDFLREGHKDVWLRQGDGAMLRLRHDVTCLQCWTKICGDRCIKAGRWTGALALRGALDGHHPGGVGV